MVNNEVLSHKGQGLELLNYNLPIGSTGINGPKYGFDRVPMLKYLPIHQAVMYAFSEILIQRSINHLFSLIKCPTFKIIYISQMCLCLHDLVLHMIGWYEETLYNINLSQYIISMQMQHLTDLIKEMLHKGRYSSFMHFILLLDKSKCIPVKRTYCVILQ